MSSDILDNISPIKDEKEIENNDINQFSRNFSKYYYNVRNIQEKEEEKEKKKKYLIKAKIHLIKINIIKKIKKIKKIKIIN